MGSYRHGTVRKDATRNAAGVARILTAARERLGLSQSDIARHLDVQPSFISDIEKFAKSGDVGQKVPLNRLPEYCDIVELSSFKPYAILKQLRDDAPDAVEVLLKEFAPRYRDRLKFVDDVAIARMDPKEARNQKLDIDIVSAKWRARQHGTIDKKYRELTAMKRDLMKMAGFSDDAIESAMKAEDDKLWEQAHEACGKPGSGPEAPAA